MTGDKKIPLLTGDDILFYTGGGRDIYIRYLGKADKIMKRPWGKDRKPSWGVFLYNGLYFWKDQATENSGTAIQFVQKMFGLTYKEALDKLIWDFGLGGKESKVERIDNQYVKEEKKPVHIAYTLQPFQQRHKDFWECVGASEEWCAKFKCFAVENLTIDRKKVYIKSTERVFVYESDSVLCKVYFPDRVGMNRFRNNLPWDYLYNIDNVEKGKRIVVQKSMKDLITLALIYPNVIATQSEHLKIFTPEVVEKIENISKDIFVWYGSDSDGVKKCQNITKEFGWKYINCPKDEDSTVNDSYSYACKYGIDKLKEFCQQKQLI